MTDYSMLLIPRSGLDVRLNKNEVKEYLDWYLDIGPVRTELLTRSIKSDPQYSTWVGDFSELSLSILGKWLSTNIYARKLSSSEKSSINESLRKLNGAIQEPEITLSSQSIAQVIDTGIYLGQAIAIKVPNTRWEIVTKPKHHVYINKPILVGTSGLVQCCPIHLVYIFAIGLLHMKNNTGRLVELYNIWTHDLIQEERVIDST